MKREMTMKTDKQLQQDVLDELVWEPSVDAAEIGVSVENGVVILNGTVKSLTEKWTAERVTSVSMEFGLLQTNSLLNSPEIASTTTRTSPKRQSMRWIGILPYRAIESKSLLKTDGSLSTEAWNIISRRTQQKAQYVA